jgi:hypothetical protein
VLGALAALEGWMAGIAARESFRLTSYELPAS